VISKNDLTYIKKSGHFLLTGAATEKYNTIKKLIGNDLILTSGVRAPVKQLHLFLKKMVSEGGNLRLASTTIAPPGFTFHSVGDFDIGKAGYGQANFSSKFEQTDVFKRLHDGGYIAIRYTASNPYGVRYEPWHIKVAGGNGTA
jgi:zinc D-Ala-D-Ala carboxypeptidase